MEDNKLQDLRNEIIEKDIALTQLLEKRFELVKQVWAIKDEEGIAHRDKDAEEKIIKKLANNSELDYEFLNKIYTEIFEQNEYMYKNVRQ